MEIYAAMVEPMDFDVGRVIDYLKETNQFENTFILFLSDNGVEGMNMGNTSIFFFSPYTQNINNNYENIGNKDSLILYGSQWAQASTAPSRMNKGYITEGGIRCPAIVRYPKGKSWIPYLLNSDEHVHHAHEEQDFTGWELFGQRAIRQGNYKAVLIPNASNTTEWELYDLTQDKGELVNLADQHEAVLKNLTEDG
jgi:arylsulfatase